MPGAATSPDQNSNLAILGADLYTGSTDAIAIKNGTIAVNSSGADAMTLANPVSGADDGKEITVIDIGGHAHTITTASNKINGNKHVATFAGAVGDFITLVAIQGVWYMLAQNGITLS